VSLRVKLQHERAIRKALKKLPTDMRTAGVEALRTWGKETRDTARANVNVLTGYLKSTIRYRVNSTKLESEAGTRDELAHYGQWLEEGNSRQEAQPFLRPAADESNAKMRGWLRKAVEKHLPS
jgi:HK97 gp10 family phage protein